MEQNAFHPCLSGPVSNGCILAEVFLLLSHSKTFIHSHSSFSHASIHADSLVESHDHRLKPTVILDLSSARARRGLCSMCHHSSIVLITAPCWEIEREEGAALQVASYFWPAEWPRKLFLRLAMFTQGGSGPVILPIPTFKPRQGTKPLPSGMFRGGCGPCGYYKMSLARGSIPILSRTAGF